jgi:hypothetical protein
MPLAEVYHISVQRVLPLYPIHVPYSFFLAMWLWQSLAEVLIVWRLCAQVVIGMRYKGTACFFVSLSAIGLIYLFLKKDGWWCPNTPWTHVNHVSGLSQTSSPMLGLLHDRKSVWTGPRCVWAWPDTFCLRKRPVMGKRSRQYFLYCLQWQLCAHIVWGGRIVQILQGPFYSPLSIHLSCLILICMKDAWLCIFTVMTFNFIQPLFTHS